MKEDRFVIPKSRYDSVSTYLSPEGSKYNDIDLVLDKEIYQQLKDAGETDRTTDTQTHETETNTVSQSV